MTDNRPFKLKANEDYTKELLSKGIIKTPEDNYCATGSDGWTSFEDAHVFHPGKFPSVVPGFTRLNFIGKLYEKVYLDEPLQNQEEKGVDVDITGDISNEYYNLSRKKYELNNQEKKVLNVGNINDPNNDYFKLSPDKKELFKVTECKFIMKAQNKHAQDLISYGMTIPGEIFVYVPSPDKPIDDSNPLCFVSEDKASEFSSWPEGVSRACFFPVYNWVSLQLPGIMACSEVVCTISQPSLDEPSEDKSEERFSESNIKSLDKYLLDLQSDMLHLSEAIVAALECLRESSEENNDIFIKAYNKYRSKRGQTVLGEE